jgi:hypothetical protein
MEDAERGSSGLFGFAWISNVCTNGRRILELKPKFSRKQVRSEENYAY